MKLFLILTLIWFWSIVIMFIVRYWVVGENFKIKDFISIIFIIYLGVWAMTGLAYITILITNELLN